MIPGALWFDDLDSTNAEARRRAEAGEVGPLWIAARSQHAGKGRRGRAWSTGHGNLAATLLTTADKPPAEAAGMSFVAALAVHDLAVAYVPSALVGLKWPNDVMVAGDKLSGILVELGPRPGGVWLAVGIGVNLAVAPVAVERPATAIADHLAPDQWRAPTPEEALDRLAASFDRWFALWAQMGLAPILSAWTERAAGLPGPARARLAHETLDGHAEGLDSDGALRLRLADGSLRRITAGDVFLGGG